MANFLPESTQCILCRSQERESDAFLCSTCQQQVFRCVDDLCADKEVAIWHCPRCTLINSISKEQCEACGARKVESVCFD